MLPEGGHPVADDFIGVWRRFLDRSPHFLKDGPWFLVAEAEREHSTVRFHDPASPGYLGVWRPYCIKFPMKARYTILEQLDMETVSIYG